MHLCKHLAGTSMSRAEGSTTWMKWKQVCLPKTNTNWKCVSAMVTCAAGACTVITSRIFLKQGKKVEGQLDRNNMSEERRGPSREEWNFPQVQCVYLGLAGPSNDETMLKRAVILLSEIAFLSSTHRLPVASWPFLFPLSVSLRLSLLCLLLFLLLILIFHRSHTRDVLMCVQEKETLTCREGKFDNRP